MIEKMTNKTDSEIVFAHIRTNPGAFLEALRNSPIEQKEAILTYMRELPEVKATDDKSADTIE